MSPELAFSMRLSLQVAACATVLVTLVGVGAAYLLATRDFLGKALLDAVLTLSLVLPPVVTGYYLLLLIGRNGPVGRLVSAIFGADTQLTFTWGAAVLAAFAVSVPLTVKTARAAIEAVDIKLVNASYALGRSEMETALRVTLPLASRGIFAGVVLSFARALGEFGATIMVAGNIPGKTNTMPLELFNSVLYGEAWTTNMIVALFTVFSLAVLMTANWMTKGQVTR